MLTAASQYTGPGVMLTKEEGGNVPASPTTRQAVGPPQHDPGSAATRGALDGDESSGDPATTAASPDAARSSVRQGEQATGVDNRSRQGLQVVRHALRTPLADVKVACLSSLRKRLSTGMALRRGSVDAC